MVKPDEKDAMKIRRHIALTSFYSLLATLFICLLTALYGDETSAKNIATMAIVLSPIIISLTGLIAGYKWQCVQGGKKDVGTQ